MNNIENFGNILKQIRREKGLTQTQLGKKIGLSKKSISYYEKSKSIPSEHLIKLATALGISTDELLGLKELSKKKIPLDINIVKKVKLIQSLPIRDQKAIFRLINSIVEKSEQKQPVETKN